MEPLQLQILEILEVKEEILLFLFLKLQ